MYKKRSLIFVLKELGAEMVIDEDGMYAMGMMNKTLRIGESKYLKWFLRFFIYRQFNGCQNL